MIIKIIFFLITLGFFLRVDAEFVSRSKQVREANKLSIFLESQEKVLYPNGEERNIIGLSGDSATRILNELNPGFTIQSNHWMDAYPKISHHKFIRLIINDDGTVRRIERE
eukprot:TRINITY_DN12179_c0_g1_i1.p1 TRINITY_DN12179_c0_g1~~TRINITY_DN12179_c0_g1_i1.p1  ORF type:complete len:111 (+),score=7.65 TRINITY_DN12179_c0_g1_i1:7-339(+)